MKPIIFAIAAMALYALQNVLMEQKLAKYSVAVLLMYFYLPILVIATATVGVMRGTGAELAFPTGKMILLTIAVGNIYFFADLFFVGAYTSGGNLFTIVAIAGLYPVFASLMKWWWTGSAPNGWQVAGYLCALVAVLLVTRGSMASPPP